MNRTYVILGGLFTTAAVCVAAAIKAHKSTWSEKQIMKIFEELKRDIRKSIPLTANVVDDDTLMTISTDNGAVIVEVSLTGIRCTNFDGSITEFDLHDQYIENTIQAHVMEQYTKMINARSDRQIITDMIVHNLHDVYTHYHDAGYNVRRFGVALDVTVDGKTVVIYRDSNDLNKYIVFRLDGLREYHSELPVSSSPSVIIKALDGGLIV